MLYNVFIMQNTLKCTILYMLCAIQSLMFLNASKNLAAKPIKIVFSLSLSLLSCIWLSECIFREHMIWIFAMRTNRIIIKNKNSNVAGVARQSIGVTMLFDVLNHNVVVFTIFCWWWMCGRAVFLRRGRRKRGNDMKWMRKKNKMI